MANKNVILDWNCDGLQGKRNDIELILTKFKPAVLCLQETKLNPDIEKLQKHKN